MQITVRKAQLKAKTEKSKEKARAQVYNMLSDMIDYMSYENPLPVDTGAYVGSMSLNPRGNRSGPAKGKRGRRKADPNMALNDMEARLTAGLDSIEDPLDGATIINKAPHAKEVHLYVRDVFAELRDMYGL